MIKVLIYSISIVLFAGFGSVMAGETSATTTQLIRNALIIDGTGKARHQGDVRFDKSGIIEIGELSVLDTDTVVDAQGQVLAPGFIDSHSHHDSGLESGPLAVAAISQGITTIVVGNDGSSNFPL